MFAVNMVFWVVKFMFNCVLYVAMNDKPNQEKIMSKKFNAKIIDIVWPINGQFLAGRNLMRPKYDDLRY